MKKLLVKVPLLLAGVAALAWSFWANTGWLQLCAGLALFLFGMQCLEEGLRQLAGSRLESMLARSTSTKGKGLLFGMGATMLLQSTTLVSLLTIAFISTGLIQLAGGVSIIFGINVGATLGVWLLALAGQNVSLSVFALPLLVFGVLASFTGARGKAAGRIVLGIAFIFLGIDDIKQGFSLFGGELDLSKYDSSGWLGGVLFIGIGLVATLVLQSSHATLMLAMTALASGQLLLGAALHIAIGALVGSSISTAIVGALGSNRSGQRLALAHVLFNVSTALLGWLLLTPLQMAVTWASTEIGFGQNKLIQLAMFHTMFNSLAVMVYWPWQAQLVQLLQYLLPDKAEPEMLLESASESIKHDHITQARYLNDSALESADAAASAVAQEVQHLERLSVEVICHALFLPASVLRGTGEDDTWIDKRPDTQAADADDLYQRHIKGVYGDLLSFMGRVEAPMSEYHQNFWVNVQVVSLQLVDAVKDAKHLQKNLRYYLMAPDSPARDAYVELRRHLMGSLQKLHDLAYSDLEEEPWRACLDELDTQAARFDAAFRKRLFDSVRENKLDGLQMSSLMNDLGYVSRIIQSLRNALKLAEDHEITQQLRHLNNEEEELLETY